MEEKKITSVIEVPCDVLDCLNNDKSREATGEGFCTLTSLPIRKGYCISYKSDKEWKKDKLKQYLRSEG